MCFFLQFCLYSFAFTICPRVLSVHFFFFSFFNYFLIFKIFNNFFTFYFNNLFYFILSFFLFFLPFLLSRVADRVLLSGGVSGLRL